MPTILVVDDDRAILLLIRQAFDGVLDVVTAETAAEGMRRLDEHDVDAVLLDIILPDRNGMTVFRDIQAKDRRLPVVLMTVEATSQTAIEAMQLGAFDYLAKPLSVTELRSLVSRAIEQRELVHVPVAIVAEEIPESAKGELFIGHSPPMLDVFKAIGRVSKQKVPVLICGESGTGKELVAKALYQHSDRLDGPFLAVNCAALPESLLESELFGHEQGAFTGAESRRIGKFEQCNGGTLFLDEIGDMSPMVQAKVLRVLQEQRFERVGGNRELTTDVRIVAATNRDLAQMVDNGLFREDLLYRLNAVTIALPPLRQRPGDIPALVQYFLGQAKREFNKPNLEGLSPDSLELLQAYHWPGNVRQLRAVIWRSVLDCALPVIGPADLPEQIRKSTAAQTASRQTRSTQNQPDHDGTEATADGFSDGRGLPELVDRLLKGPLTDVYAETIAYAEQFLLLTVLRQTEGNQSRAAEILGITRGKLRNRIAAYHIRIESGVKIGE